MMEDGSFNLFAVPTALIGGLNATGPGPVNGLTDEMGDNLTDESGNTLTPD